MIRDLELIAPVHISDIYTIDDCLELIYQYGELFLVAERAGKLITTIKQKRDDFKTFCRNKPGARLPILYGEPPGW